MSKQPRNLPKHFGKAAVALAFILTAASCGSGDQTATEAAPVESDATGTETAEPTDVIAASVTAETLNGEGFDFGSLEGQDAVLWFWAPW